MISIRKLIIENFQSHEYTEIDFSDGLNVIVGPSDHGKSAILRAIKWVLYNEPRGSEFIRHGASFARVSMELSNGIRIVRERSASKNNYVLIKPDGDTQKYEGFGNEIPQEIINAHGIPKIVLDSDIETSLNMSDQLEGAFLLSETGAVRAKSLGRLTGVHIVDKAIRDCIGDLRREGQNETRIRGEIEEIDKSIEKLAEVESLKDKIDTVSQIAEKIEKLSEKNERCINIREKYNMVNKDIQHEKDVLKKLKDVEKHYQTFENIQLKVNFLKQLEKLRYEYQDVIKKINENEEFIRKAELKSGEELYSKLSDRIAKIVKMHDIRNRKDSVEKNIAEGNKYVSNIKSEIESQTEEFAEIMKKLGKCPLCLSDINDEMVAKIVSGYREENR